MALITRRRFVQETAIATATLYGRRINAAPLDAAAIRKFASKITGQGFRCENR